jgi:hypothetical protein
MIEPNAAPALEPTPKLFQIAKLALAWSVIAGGFLALAASLLVALGGARAEPTAARYGVELGAAGQAEARAAAQDARS